MLINLKKNQNYPMKNILSALLLFQFSLCFSQIYDGVMVSNTNDTTVVKIQIKDNMVFKNNKILALQKNITILTNNNKTFDLYPKDLKSFKIRREDKVMIFDSMNGTEFAERLYVNKAKLYFKLVWEETIFSPYFRIYRVYMFVKPNGEIKYLVPNGFSRLLSQKIMLQNFTDCPIIFEKLSKDELKIRNDEKLIEFTKDYEKNCF